MVEDEAAALGPWKPSELAETATAEAGVGADEGLPEVVRFRSNVAKLIRRRKAQPDAESDPVYPAVFLLQPTPPELVPGDVLKRQPMLDNGLTSVNGYVWFVSALVVSGHFIKFSYVDDDAMFRLVTDSWALGETPAIVFDPRSADTGVRFYEHGFNRLDHYEFVSLGDGEVTLDQVFEVIERIHKECLVTPFAQSKSGKLWHNPDRWLPISNAEDVIQYALRLGLVGAFPTSTVRPEQTMSEGRSDLEIEQSDPIDRSKVTRHALLELKVLRSFGEGGAKVTEAYTRDWVESGVKQAATYGSNKGAKASALCCFDMRQNNTSATCFEHVHELAESLSVKLKRWFIFSSADHYRNHLTSGS